MKTMTQLSGHIGIWGFGKEGRSVYDALKWRGGYESITVLDDNEATDIPSDAAVLNGAAAHKAIQSGQFDIIFKSPGISLYRPEIREAKINGTLISSATNLWFAENTNTKKIVVTGTKGKSTTSSLLYHVMREAGLNVELAGNVGIPLLGLKEQADYTVIELSSYQLSDLNYAPDIFAVLNLFPEHLQWHITHKNYYNDKLHPLELKSDMHVIANKSNEQVFNLVSRTNKKITWFGDAPFKPAKTQLKGAHNQDNIEAVLTICAALGINEQECRQHIESFAPLKHRLQEFTTNAGLVCVNDSISTTPESAMAAMEVYQDKNLILIMGGTDRGQDYAVMIERMKSLNVNSVLLLPKNGNRLAEELKAADFKSSIIECDDLQTAVKHVRQNASQDSVILLSPAAPSYDQFDNFEQRGDLFIELMNA